MRSKEKASHQFRSNGVSQRFDGPRFSEDARAVKTNAKTSPLVQGRHEATNVRKNAKGAGG